jgi:hypothetical protein
MSIALKSIPAEGLLEDLAALLLEQQLFLVPAAFFSAATLKPAGHLPTFLISNRFYFR